MTKPKLLDLFCGAGGCSMGYHMAGFDVVGVDINPQKNYPFEFIQADAMTFPLDGFDVIHASPPCQAYSLSRNNGCHRDAPMLVDAVRERLASTGCLYVIENVMGAPLRNAALLCGASFGLGASGMDLPRHRLFESNIVLLSPGCSHRRGKTMGVYGNGTNRWHLDKLGRCLNMAEMCEAMGIDWMVRKELSQAIPPAYTHFIGNQLIHALRKTA